LPDDLEEPAVDSAPEVEDEPEDIDETIKPTEPEDIDETI